MTRRQIVGQIAAIGAASNRSAWAAALSPGVDFKLGICSYTFREFQRHMAISMMKQLGVSYVSVKDFHLPYTVNVEEARKAVNEFAKAGLTIVSGGNTDLTSEDPAVLRRAFEYARRCGMPTDSCAQRANSQDRTPAGTVGPPPATTGPPGQRQPAAGPPATPGGRPWSC